MNSEQDTDGVARGEIHEDTATGLACMLLAGIFIGNGATIVALGFNLVEVTMPLLSGVIGVGGGAILAYFALWRVPDARTVAMLVEEVDFT